MVRVDFMSHCGVQFDTTIQIGADVICPNGHTVSYDIVPGEDISICDCPVCRKRFSVDLVDGIPDIDESDESAWAEYYNVEVDGDLWGSWNAARTAGWLLQSK